MKIRVAGHAGFCMGVKRALESLLKERGKEKGALYTYGPIIHNAQVLELLEKKGILVLPEEGPVQRGTVVLRAHGAPPEVKERLRAMGLRVVDGTCPKVRWVQGLVKKHIKLGDDVVILGEPHHPEVIGLVGHGMGKPYVIQGPDQINSLPRLRSPVLLAQTTQERGKFSETEKALRALYPDLKIHDTICDATKERQEEVRQLAQRVDAIVVVGGRHSGNTKRLLEVAKATGKPSYLIERELELNPRWLEGIHSVGVTAGASTPNWIIIRVLRRLEEINRQKESLLNKIARTILRFSYYTGILPALSLASVLVGIQWSTEGFRDLTLPLTVSLLFVSMLITARYFDKESMSYNDPNMYQFLIDYRTWVMGFGAITFLIGLIFTTKFLTIYHTLFALLLFLGVLGYRMQKTLRLKSAFSLPGIRTLGEATIFSILSGPFIMISDWIKEPVSAVIPLFLCLSFGFSRSFFQDILHFQGDLLVGEKSLSVKVGDETLMKWLYIICILQVLVLLIYTISDVHRAIPPLIGSILFLLIVYTYNKKFVIIPSRAEIFSELALISIAYFVWIMDEFSKITK